MLIRNSEKVISYFGYWPEFCDAKILSFHLMKSDKDIRLIIKLKYIDSDLNKSAGIELTFESVRGLNINNIFDENVIDLITIRRPEGDQGYSISIEACSGCSGEFYCNGISSDLMILDL